MSNSGVALITGSSRGIGRAIAEQLAAAGFSIALNAPQEDDELHESKCALQKFDVPVFLAPFDIGDIECHDQKLKEIETALGSLTTFVNNAGVGAMKRGDVLDVTEASFDRCIAINAKALFFLTQRFCRRLLSRERTDSIYHSIVNITSANAVAASDTRAEYCASKSAASMITRTFATRLGRENIAVFDVQPGLIETSLTAPVIEKYKEMASEGFCLMPRLGQPEDVGKVVAALALGQMPYVTGQTISVDGGMLVPRF